MSRLTREVHLICRFIAQLKQHISSEEFSHCLLILAGGHDPKNEENIEYHRELRDIVASEGLTESVLFCLSPGIKDRASASETALNTVVLDDNTKIQLIHKCSVVLYTPRNEHFGIVPIEVLSPFY